MQSTLTNIPKKFPILLAIISFVGFLDATYLTVEHFLGRIPPCSAVAGCESVLTSAYSSIAGIPVSLAGSVFYLVVCILSLVYLDSKKEKLLKIALGLTIPAFVASLGFVYLQLFVIKAICLYCMGSALTSTLLFIIAVIAFSWYRKRSRTEVTSSQM